MRKNKPKTKPIPASQPPPKAKTNPIKPKTNPIPAGHATASPNAGYATQNRLLNYEIQQGRKNTITITK
jgi:hypothetical protein